MPESAIGPYQLLGSLGAGGMGEVYRALDPRIGRQVALKLLPKSLVNDGERRRRFEQEARLAASLNHPNVMAIYDVGLDHDPPYIVAELVSGELLRALIDAGPLPVRKAVDIAAQIASGLAAAHTAGIVHRDLKPENVIVTAEGVAKLLDFGVARVESKKAAASETVTIANTALGAVVGTAGYMSPEQARGQEIDSRSDQFSLGLVIYEMLTGKQAFARASAVQTMSAIIEEDAPPIDRALPPQLRWVMERCLAKEPAGRYESTRDLARDLATLRDRFGELTGGATGTQAAAAAPARATPQRGISWRSIGACAIAAAAAWSAAQLLRDPHKVDLARYHVTPFATELTEQSMPAWSPDGKSIAFFGADESHEQQLYVQGADSPTAVQISRGPYDVYGYYPPLWTPDSRAIFFRCGKGDDYGLCRIPAGGGESRLIQPLELNASMSPDGQTLAMLAFGSASDRTLKVMTATPPDATPKPYLPAPFPPGSHFNNPAIAFAPDGKSIAIAVAFEGRGETTWLLPWPPAQARPLFPQALPFANTPQISWMPDSRHLIFADSSAGHHYELFMADVNRGAWWPLYKQDRPARQPSVSPSGSALAYQSNLSHADVIAVPLGSGPVRTLLGSSRTEQMADASPVAAQVVYVTDRRGAQEIWIDSTAEGWDRPLVQSGTRLEGSLADVFLDPVFSADGRRVAFAAKSGSRVHVYTTFVSGGTPVRATNIDGLEDAPTWSPDGNWIAFGHIVGADFVLGKVRPGSGERPIDLGRIGGGAVPAWSPTGEWIAMHDGEDKLTLFSPDGKPSRALPGDGGPVAWSRDGKTLYQVRAEPPALVAIDITTKKETKLRDLEDLAPYTASSPGLMASLTSDGKSIVYTVNRARTEIWILDGIQPPRPWWQRMFGR
jgi:Tol biopolymer transport system component/tRNA A-37 threonylcarbamoyl transferase component Bud32